MATTDTATVEHYLGELGKVFRNRRVLLIGGPVARLVGLARHLRRLGAERPFILGSSVGTGELPTEEEADWCSLEVRAATLNDAFRSYETLLGHLPEDARQRLDAWDPERRAIAIGPIILNDLPMVSGRPRYGGRPRSWAALEDKVVIDEVWDALGVRRAPSVVVRPEPSSLRDAATSLDRGLGTVWAADARDGIHRSADFLRWVRTPSDFDQALAFFATRCNRIRIMPFLEGIPCSIHGMVLPTGTAVFRPLELMTLRRPEQGRLVYAGTNTFWDPPARAREQMRQVARVVAEGLARRVGFRGAFTVDGVLTEEGFLPTELNPRIGAGLNVLERSLEGLPLLLLAIAAQAGEELDFRPADLEELVVRGADARRAGAASVVVTTPLESTRRLGLMIDGELLKVVRPGERAHAELLAGPSDLGGFVRFTPQPAHVETGKPLAPLAVEAFRVADRELEAGIGPLQAPRDVLGA